MTTTTETSSILQSALTSVIDSAECRRVIDEIKRGARLISISGLVAGPAKALVLPALRLTRRLWKNGRSRFGAWPDARKVARACGVPGGAAPLACSTRPWRVTRRMRGPQVLFYLRRERWGGARPRPRRSCAWAR